VKKIANGINFQVKKRKLYYYKVKYLSGGDCRFKVFRCDLNGKNKKALTKWLEEIPDSYAKYMN